MAEVHSIHSQADLEALTASHKYVVLDFWAEWCPPCKAIAPFYAQLARRLGVQDTLAFAKIDVEELPDVSQSFGITAMPSFLVLQNGVPEGVELPAAVLAADGRPSGAVITDGKVGLIRGADPRVLTALAEKLNELAKEHAGRDGN